jgi:acyl-CoA synthetase (AMP-forming)/AMP-acid ligase II
LTPQDVLLSVTTISFDIAGLELFLPLIVGACVVIVSREVALDGVRLSQFITDSKATVMQATPATWRMLLGAGWQGSKQLKILCGGEALPAELAKQLLERSESLWNLYGPTESTIWSTLYRVKSVEGTVPIGRPIANTEIYILDGYLKPVPIGVPGELHIGGAGLARGYLKRPDLTAEKFIGHPFSTDPTARLYKTGDLACYRSDGGIEYLGRLDHQVKIRGFRIELGEIESVLSQHPGVRETVAVVREDESGDRRLVAYIVSNSDSTPTAGELRNFLKSKLPDYMIPSAIISLDALPLTSNGKVDRKALPAPDATRPELEAIFVGPQSRLETILVAIWSGVLGLERVGIHDNFFELGGHSLLLARVHGQLQTVLRRDLPMIELFRYPTICTLAKNLIHAPEQDSLKASTKRGEKQRSAFQHRQRIQAIGQRRPTEHQRG